MAGKMTTRPLLQDLIKSAMEESLSRVDISNEAARQAGNAEGGQGDTPAKTASAHEKVIISPEPVEKLAAALDYLAGEFRKEANSKNIGPGMGGNALHVSTPSPTAPLPFHFGHGHNTVPMATGLQKGLKTEHVGGLVPNDLDHTPGGNERAPQNNNGKHAASEKELEDKETEGLTEAEKGLAKVENAHAKEKAASAFREAIKTAFSVTQEGHAQDAKKHRSIEHAHHEHREANDEYAKKAPIRAALGNTALESFGHQMGTRHENYAAGKHEKGQNAYNPFGGMLTKTEREKKSGAELGAFLAARVKQAEDAINPAHITGPKAVPPETSASGERGGAPAGGMPQGPTGLIASAAAAQNFTRGQAYAGRKAELAKYFKEPALTSSTDNVLNVAFKHTSQAGPKLASAEALPMSVKTAAGRALLTKLAEQVKEQMPAAAQA